MFVMWATAGSSLASVPLAPSMASRPALYRSFPPPPNGMVPLEPKGKRGPPRGNVHRELAFPGCER